MWQTNLIKLYCTVCDNSSTIEAVTQRQSNNFCPQFSDEECITVYLWGISQRRFKQKRWWLASRAVCLFRCPWGRLYADKACIDADWKESLKKKHALELLTPRKKRKDDILISGDAFSTLVSSLRQPIECFFNWLNRLTNIQSASMVRSLSGLLLHVFERIAAA